VGFVLPIALMTIYFRRLTQPQKRREVGILLAVFIPTIALNVIFQGVLPSLGFRQFPVSAITVVVMNLVVTYAITRYGLHIFNLSIATANIAQIMPAGLIILDHTETIQYVNKGTVGLFGYSADQMLGASVKRLLGTSQVYQQFRRRVAGKLATQEEVAISDITLQRRDGVPIPVSINATSVREGSELINTVLVVTDISKLKAIENELMHEKAGVEQKVVERTRELGEAQAQLIASIRGLPFGFAVVDGQNQILFANSVLAQLVHRSIPDNPAESRQVLEQIAADYAGSIDLLGNIRKVQETRQPIEQSIAFGPRFFRFFFMPITTQADAASLRVIGTVVIMEDVTEEKALQRSRDEFFSIASHELRTPLTAIRGNSDMILGYYKEQLKDPELKGMVGDIHQASMRLIDIVNDFLDMSRLEQGKLVFKKEPFDIVSLINQILREYDVTGSRKKLYLKLETPPQPELFVLADKDRIRQVIVNLIANAIKFTDRGGVTVRLTPAGATLRLAVVDTGKGIPMESQHLLFHKFQQASNNILTRDNTQSTGLGLYIARLVVEGMGGKIYLEHSEVDKGSVFTLELPVVTSDPVKPSDSLNEAS
jgi:PAS domain S-box-containing protein